MKTASRVPGWAPQVTATWYPVVSPRRCNCSGVSGVGGVLGRVRRPGAARRRGQFDAHVGDQSGAGDLGDADGVGKLGYQLVCSPGRPAHWVHAQVGALASERTGVGVLWMVTS